MHGDRGPEELEVARTLSTICADPSGPGLLADCDWDQGWVASTLGGLSGPGGRAGRAVSARVAVMREVNKSEAEWRAQLSAEQYRVLREAGTERAFSGAFWDQHAPGRYRCVGCQALLFDAAAKFDSGCGWPSFYEAIDRSTIEERVDSSHGMQRIEVLCRRCGGHLGHVFPDGPRPTGLRYCINSASLGFDEGEGEGGAGGG